MKSERKIILIVTMIVFIISLLLGGIVPGVSARDMVIEITKYSVSSDIIVPGEKFTLNMAVKNNSNKGISELYLEVQELSGFSLAEPGGREKVSASLAAGDSVSLSMSMVYNGGGDGQIPISFSYIKAGYPRQIGEERYLSVKLKDDGIPPGKHLPILNIESKESLYTAAGQQIKAAIKIQNISSYPAREVLIKASFADDAPITFPGEQMFYFRSLGSGESKTINLTMLTGENAKDASYIMKLDYEFTNSSGDSWAAFENLYVRVVEASEPPALLITPQLEEEIYLFPGGDYKLLINIKNQGGLTARDISVSLEGLSSAGISLSSSSSRQYIDDIKAGTEREISYQLKANPELLADSYPIILKAMYADQTGTVYSSEQEIVLRVGSEEQNQEAGGPDLPELADNKFLSRLEVGNIRFTGDLKRGNLVNMYCTYFNTGTSLLNNLIINIEGDFEAADKSVFVGDMELDGIGYYRTVIKPLKDGEINGKLIFSYQDLSGGPLILEEPFALNNSKETVAANINTGDVEQNEKGFAFWYIIITVPMAGAAIAGRQIQRKKQQDEELPVDQ